MELKFILEAILFAAQKPLTPQEMRGLLVSAAEDNEDPLVRGLKKTKLNELEAALDQLAQDHAQNGRSYTLVCVAGAWLFVSRPEYVPWLKALAGERNRPSRLSQPALETLTIIAYRQPITRAEMEQIRGVSVDGVMQTLVERGLVEAMGRAEVVGRPMTYGTTKLFLEYFGLSNLDGLPDAEELRRIPVEHPPSLVTTEPGLATVPPEQLATPTSEAPSNGNGAESAPPVEPAAPAESPTPVEPATPAEEPPPALEPPQQQAASVDP